MDAVRVAITRMENALENLRGNHDDGSYGGGGYDDLSYGGAGYKDDNSGGGAGDLSLGSLSLN